LSRVFYDVIGMSFREKRAEIRLALARDLLATSQAKVVDVAFKSGYKSLSLFNRMFTRRFGISPGRWRQKNGGIKGVVEQRKPRARVAVNESRFRGLQ
jgi:AraC-like DNA-binding protein